MTVRFLRYGELVVDLSSFPQVAETLDTMNFNNDEYFEPKDLGLSGSIADPLSAKSFFAIVDPVLIQNKAGFISSVIHTYDEARRMENNLVWRKCDKKDQKIASLEAELEIKTSELKRCGDRLETSVNNCGLPYSKKLASAVQLVRNARSLAAQLTKSSVFSRDREDIVQLLDLVINRLSRENN